MEHLKRKAALGIFALLVTAAPLLFGAVDRQIQIGLVALLAAGLFLSPIEVPRLSAVAKRLLCLWIALVVVKEFAPWNWFGAVKWRTILTQSFGMTFPWMHNPEPGRAVDLLLVIIIGALWFLWVRTLASDGENRGAMLWSMFISAGITAVVCLVTIHPSNPHLIYGIRFTDGWTGFGPFPNRNHTASFLAMGALLGCGCLTNAVRHKKQSLGVAGLVLMLVILVALLLSKSRGGLIALTIGLVVYGLLIICKLRSRKAILAVAAGGLVFAVLCIAFGGQVLSRFHEAGEGEIPTNIRWHIYADTLAMWKDAPLLGHGLGTFPQIFPLYQTLNLENQTVGHPESSWLLWLVELGIVPLLIAAGAGAVFLTKNLRGAIGKKQGFFLRASAFAAFSVLIIHAMFDVPAHRWATAGFALAILAVACPFPSRKEKKVVFGRKMALIPLGTALFWLLPFVANFPAWSPSSLTKSISLDDALVSEVRLENELRYFPLSPSLHYSLGTHLLGEYKEVQAAWEHFRIADRLEPASWSLPAAEAEASRAFSPGMTLHYWSLAIERSGHRKEEIFFLAWNNTESFPMAPLFWNNYVETNPQLLLSYPRVSPGVDGRYYFQRWWNERAFSDDIAQFEIENFYAQAAKYGNIAGFRDWISRHPTREDADYKDWAALLHHWNDDAYAWQILSRRTKEPEYPSGSIPDKQDVLESKWFSEPDDVLNAQNLAKVYAATGHPEKEREVIAAVASQQNAPPWFLQKAAFLQAAAGHYDQAVMDLLRDQLLGKNDK